ncbi:factor-independent urate hydroxylase [Acidicapsa ligni]|uniref:factor-independent urate hydroxylase n=1 Tax=Acidicapsa ligni TaxID=542300 RepID=UPI0021E0060F|nr:urate oxidase [Acidicapsa ligni]
MAHLGENRYGKSRVRVMKVVRHETHHAMKEWSVQVLLHGDFESAFTDGDNSRILPTDTMKNTVYWLARESQAATLEEFAIELVHYLLLNNSQVTKASVEIEEKSWKQALINGLPHATTYTMTGPELQTAKIEQLRGEKPKVTSGVDGLMILKTTKSAFTGYIKDKLTTLPESTDRILGTRATIAWEYDAPPASYELSRSRALETLIQTFAEHDSLSVQHTLYDMGKDLIEAIPEIARVTLTMPNLHCLLVDLSRFGQNNPNQVFVPIDEPHGYIEAVIER